MKKLSIVIPCYQSEKDFDNLIAEIGVILPVLKQKVEVEFILVDDGSTDKTFEGMNEFKKNFPESKLVKLTGNFGSYSAFLAGLTYSTGNCFSQLHPDLQDPPQHLPQMIDYWTKGIKLVIGQRVEREESILTRFFAALYHFMMKRIAIPHIPSGGYDLILFDKEIRDEIVRLNESNINQVYLISSLKHPFVTIPVTRVKRKQGKSAWTWSKKIKLLFDSIVGFSYFPIQLISLLALLIGLSFLAFSGIALYRMATGAALSQLFKMVYALTFFSSILSLMLAIIGEYLWRTLESARKRAPYVVDKIIE